MSHFQITDFHFRGHNFPCISTTRSQKSNKFAVCVPVLLCQGGEKVVDCWLNVKYIISLSCRATVGTLPPSSLHEPAAHLPPYSIPKKQTSHGGQNRCSNGTSHDHSASAIPDS